MLGGSVEVVGDHWGFAGHMRFSVDSCESATSSGRAPGILQACIELVREKR